MNIVFVVKASKLCNLRCTYCYETPELANPARMSLGEIETFYLRIVEYLREWGKTHESHHVEFIWHGGEPLAQPLAYWKAVHELQQQVFDTTETNVTVSNALQTNLTLISPKHLPLLRRFNVGFSYDVINDLRITANGQSTNELVLKNVRWLLSENVPLGGIAVISKSNVHDPQSVAEFFIHHNIPFRVLHIFHGKDLLPSAEQVAVSFREYITFCQTLAQLPCVGEALTDGLSIDPFSTSRLLLERRNSESLPKSVPSTRHHQELALVVNTNGDIYPPGDCFHPKYCYGNIFTQSFEEILYCSDGRTRRIERTEERLQTICTQCFLFKNGCEGAFVSHASPEEYREFKEMGSCHYGALAAWMQDRSVTTQNGPSLHDVA